MGFFGSLFKSYSEKQIAKIIPIVDKIEGLSEKFEGMADYELRSYTDKLKKDLAGGKTLDDILPEAFALVREADWRVLGKRPFRVQIMGGILIHQGRIAEMKTGEGKTLVATMPAYLNALTGKGVHVVTVNDYLAERDSAEMGKVYGFLGLTTGLVLSGQSHNEKKTAYEADITYGTNNELGFDYLRDNMSVRKEATVQRGHNFAIVDEVDSILIDEARTPLIISGESSKSTDLYGKVDELVRKMSHLSVKEFDAKTEYDIDKEYFDADGETGNGALYEWAVSDFKKCFEVSEENLIYDADFSVLFLDEGAKSKLIENYPFDENDFVKNEDVCGYLLTKSAVERAEEILNRNFNFGKNGKNQNTLTEKGVKKLVSFFEFKDTHFRAADNSGDNYFILKDGVLHAKKHISFNDKDFLDIKDGGEEFFITDQGVNRINSLLTFDYFVDEKGRHSVLTKRGIDKSEKFFGIQNLSSPENSELQHHISIAIRAHGVMKKDVDYIVRDNAVLIVDTFTGRLMPGRRYNDGLHQAIEAKEGVAVQKESQTVATITFQNFFRLYGKLSGMTGTALTEDNEFREIYALDVVEVPTNRPMIRIDHNDSVYRTREEKLNAVISQIKECNEKGQPVLVGTVSVDKSEELSRLLKKAKIPHNILNAKQHEKEAAIIANAGTAGAVTISTNMAGRGTDIMLGGNPEFMAKEKLRADGFDDSTVALASGTSKTEDENVLDARRKFREYIEYFKEKISPEAEKVREAGGLFIIGTERHESRRIDNQLRGRSGRQGDPGESRFYLSLQDDLLRLFGSDKMMKLASYGIEAGKPIEAKILTYSIEKAQKSIEVRNFSSRKHVLSYDDVMNHQRNIIYSQRNDVLMQDNIQEKIEDMIRRSISEKFEEFISIEPTSQKEFFDYYHGALDAFKDKNAENLNHSELDAYKEKIIEGALELYRAKDDFFKGKYEGDVNPMREIEKTVFLQYLDKLWMEHLESMDELKGYVGLNSYAQRDPITMFRIESGEMFEKMTEQIRENTVKKLLLGRPQIIETNRVEVVKATGYGGASSHAKRQPVVSKHKNIGRNDKCYCGSGKKYKDCCLNKDRLN